MSRQYHSASSAKTGFRCRRLWAYQYIDGIRDPEIPWALIESGEVKALPRQRSVSLGKAVHAVGEDFYGGLSPQWHSLPGQIYASGAGALPPLSMCEAVEVERAIGFVSLPSPKPDGPTTAMPAFGVLWAGFRDLAVKVRGEPELLQIDYKTTSDIARWALTPQQLQDDLQACLYTLDLCERFRLDSVHSRWLYLETKKVRRARPVDFRIHRDHALQIIEPYAALCRELDLLERSEDAEQNPDACADYGGCPMHMSQGGPCNAQQTLRSMAAQLATKERKMQQLDQNLMGMFNAALPPNVTGAPQQQWQQPPALPPGAAPPPEGPAGFAPPAPPPAPPPEASPFAPPPEAARKGKGSRKKKGDAEPPPAPAFAPPAQPQGPAFAPPAPASAQAFAPPMAPQGQVPFAAPAPAPAQAFTPPMAPQGQVPFAAPAPAPAQAFTPPVPQGQVPFAAPAPAPAPAFTPPVPQGQAPFAAPAPAPAQAFTPPVPQGQVPFAAPAPAPAQAFTPPVPQGQVPFAAPTPASEPAPVPAPGLVQLPAPPTLSFARRVMLASEALIAAEAELHKATDAYATAQEDLKKIMEEGGA